MGAGLRDRDDERLRRHDPDRQPDDGRHPPEWFVRSEDFAAVCLAPFFSEELPFAADETLRLRYAVLVADGLTDDDRAKSLAAQAQKALTS
ncbi:MAG TPA: DUF6807 family protein [Kribbella sp.]